MSSLTIDDLRALGQKVAQATTPADAIQAARVRAALTQLDTLKSGAGALKTTYGNAGTAAQKQTVIVNNFPAVLDGLIKLLDIQAGTIRALVRET